MSHRDALKKCRTHDQRDGNRSRAFQCIEQQRYDSECGRFTSHVSSADVSTPGTADVFTIDDAHEEVAEGNGTQQVTCGGNHNYKDSSHDSKFVEFRGAAAMWPARYSDDLQAGSRDPGGRPALL